jgi:hypothetical protein
MWGEYDWLGRGIQVLRLLDLTKTRLVDTNIQAIAEDQTSNNINKPMQTLGYILLETS